MSSDDEKTMKKAVNKTAKGAKKEEPPKKQEAPKKGKKKHDESDDEEVPQKPQQLSDDEEDTKKGKKSGKAAVKKEEPPKKEAPKKGKKKHGDSDDEDEPKQAPKQQSDDEDEDDHKKGKKAAKGAAKKEEPAKKEAPKKGKKRQDDSDDDEKPAQKAASDDEDEDDHKKGKKAAKGAVKKEEPAKKEAPKKGKKKHGDSDDEDEPKQAPKQQSDDEDEEDNKKGKKTAKTAIKKEEPVKKEAPKKGKKKQEESDDDEKPIAIEQNNDEEEDSKPKGGHKKAPAKLPFKKNDAPKKGAPKKKQEEEEGEDKEEDEDEFKVAQHSSKKANEKAKKELVQQKKLQQATGKSQAQTTTKKASNNQFAAAASSEESENSDSDSEEEEAKPSKKDNKKPAQQKGGDKKNIFAVSGSEEEEESEEESEEEEVDEEELEKERLRKEEEERKKKEEIEKKRLQEEEKKKAAAEKKRLQQEAKKKQEEEEYAALMSAVTAKKTESKPKEETAPKAEGEEDAEGEGEGEEGGEKKLSKAQQKKLKEKQKKEALASGQAVEAPAPAANDKDKKKKAAPLNKIAQLALEKQAKLQKEKEEKERLEAEEKAREEEERRKEEEEKKIKEQEKLKAKELKKQQKKDGTLKSKEQIKKEEEEALKRKLLLEQFNLQPPKLDEIKSTSTNDTKAAPKKKVKKDIFGQIIKEEEKVVEKVETKVLELEGDDWEAMMEPTPVVAPKEESKDNQADGADQKSSETSSQAEENKDDKKKALTKKEQAELEKAEKEAKKAARDEKILQGQKKNKKVEEKKEILRSPIVCILGHVDTGKTTLLDKLRRTNVQGGEAGGITQQIGATYFPGENVIAETNKCQEFYPVEVKAPGLLVIDTPGHESFSNLRTRGSSLCDFAILVIDLMHGLEQQTLESLHLLRMRKTPFVIALNKIDRTYNWKTAEFGSSFLSLKDQSKENQNDFNHRYQAIITQLAEHSFNAALYWDNPDPKTYFPIVPTSGVTGEGIPDLLSVIIKYTSMYMKSRMVVKEDSFNCTVMEVKKIDGLGVTIDAILVDGTIRKDDKIVLLGFNGPIKTKIRALLTPHPMKEMRVKGEYEHHDVIHASMGIKISAPDLEMAVAGSQLYLANTEDEEQTAIDLIMGDLDSVKKKVKLQDQGVGVAASTLGSLEALLNFLEKSKIPVSYVSVGPVSKDDITKALKSVLADDISKRRQEYACMLVFDVKVLPDAQKYAEENGVKIFSANIIYHLFDFFIKYVKECEEIRRKEEGKLAIFPCLIKPLQFFNKADPIIMGVDIERGVLKPGTPVCLYNATKLKIGVVESIESNKKSVPLARKETGSVAIRISGTGNLMAGRQFTEKDYLVSIISRKSIDALKDHFRDEVSKDEWLFIKEKLKPFFNIL